MLYKLIKSFSYAIAGIMYCIKTQRNMQIHFIAAAVVLVFSFYVNLSRDDFIWVLYAIFGVIIAEMFNTSIEAVVSIFTEKYHPMAKIAKDVAAGAVLLAAINALFIGCFILWPHFIKLAF